MSIQITTPCLTSTTKALLQCVAQINSDVFHDAILKVIRCYTMKETHDPFKFIELDTKTILIKTTNSGEIDLSYAKFFSPFQEYPRSATNHICGWYFFVNQDSIDYIGVGGTGKSDLRDRIPQHFQITKGKTLYHNYYRSMLREERERWVAILKANYRIRVVYTDYLSLEKYANHLSIEIEDVLYVVESFLIGIFQPQYNRQ